MSVPVICAIESGPELEAAEEIAGVPGVLTLSLGSRDLTADLGCADTEEDLRPVRERLVAACRAAGRVGPVDSVYGGDEAVLSAAAESARRLGFSGKSTLRREDVAAINRPFGVPWREPSSSACRALPRSSRAVAASCDRRRRSGCQDRSKDRHTSNRLRRRLGKGSGEWLCV